MNKRFLFVIATCVWLTGCELLPIPSSSPVVNAGLCPSEQDMQAYAEFCDLSFWLEFQFNTSQIEWPEREQQINALGDSNYDRFKKVLLSQPVDTPYRNRLRAQSWLTSLIDEANPNMAQHLELVIYTSSQRILELQSAITLLTRENADNLESIQALQTQIVELQSTLDTQQKQIAELLNIEAKMIEQK